MEVLFYSAIKAFDPASFHTVLILSKSQSRKQCSTPSGGVRKYWLDLNLEFTWRYEFVSYIGMHV